MSAMSNLALELDEARALTERYAPPDAPNLHALADAAQAWQAATFPTQTSALTLTLLQRELRQEFAPLVGHADLVMYARRTRGTGAAMIAETAAFRRAYLERVARVVIYALHLARGVEANVDELAPVLASVLADLERRRWPQAASRG